MQLATDLGTTIWLPPVLIARRACEVRLRASACHCHLPATSCRSKVSGTANCHPAALRVLLQKSFVAEATAALAYLGSQLEKNIKKQDNAGNASEKRLVYRTHVNAL